jgi:hypothetical protein
MALKLTPAVIRVRRLESISRKIEDQDEPGRGRIPRHRPSGGEIEGSQTCNVAVTRQSGACGAIHKCFPTAHAQWVASFIGVTL